MRPPESVANEQRRALEESQRLRDRILGVNLRMARESAGRSIQECAGHLQTDSQAIVAWETGHGHPSPQQLELLAGYLNVSAGALLREQATRPNVDSDISHGEMLVLRQRIVGGLLRAAREAKDMELEELSDSAAIDVEHLSAYELGENVIPINHLAALADALDRDLAYFEAAETEPMPQSLNLATLPASLEIPDALRQLAADKRMEGVVELALAFSRIPGDELRRIADALLVISEDKSGDNGA